MIDVELFIGDEIVKELTDLAHNHGMPVIISNHDFDRTPPHEELIGPHEACGECPARIF